MTKDEALRDLIERVERAAPQMQSLLLEEAWEACAADSAAFRRFACAHCSGFGTNAGRFSAAMDARAYESAAIMLVPEGWRFGIEQAGAYDGSPRDEAWCWPYESNFDPDWQNGQQGYRDASDGARGYAATPALSLVAASLRAHMGTGG